MSDRGARLLALPPPLPLAADPGYTPHLYVANTDYGDKGLLRAERAGFELPAEGQIWPLPAAVVAPE